MKDVPMSQMTEPVLGLPADLRFFTDEALDVIETLTLETSPISAQDFSDLCRIMNNLEREQDMTYGDYAQVILICEKYYPKPRVWTFPEIADLRVPAI